jgi:peptide/nickel transport system substrate-binding protein
MKRSSVLLATLALTVPFTIAVPASYAATPAQLIISLGNEPDAGFDPIYGWGRYGDPLFQSTLIRRNKNLELSGDLAANWTLSSDRLTWTIELKPNIKFSNGSDLTTSDIAFTYLTAKNAATTHDLSNLVKIEVVDANKIQFVLNQPDITFIDELTSLGVVPKDSYDENYGQHPIGSGPYTFKRWDKGQQLLVTANPFYYGQKPEFENILIVFTDEDSKLALLKSGQLQLAAIPQRFSSVITPPLALWQIDSVDNRGISWPVNKPNKTDDQQANGNNVSHDPAIRQAINLAMDRDLLVNGVLNGYGRPAHSIADGMPWGPVKQNLANSADLEAAKKMLSDAGWADTNGNGTIDKDGHEANMTLLYKSGDSVREQLSIVAADMVKPLGINIELLAGSWDFIATKMHENPVLMGFGSHSAKEVRFVYHSDFAGVDFFNTGFYSSKEVDQALDQASNAPSWEASLPFWQQAQQQILADQPWTWLVNLDHLYAASSCLDLGDPIPEPHGHGWPLTANITEWSWTCQ